MATRPDICAAVNHFSQYQANPAEEHWKGLKRILRYIQGTLDLGIRFDYQSHTPLVGYADADFANNYDRKSVSGYLLEVFGNVVSWCTRKQRTVALSTTEAEFVALATACSELLWIRQFLLELTVKINGSITVFEDNQSCIYALATWDQKRLKHIDIKCNFVKDLQKEKVIAVQYIESYNQKADIMIKPLPTDTFKRHRKTLKME